MAGGMSYNIDDLQDLTQAEVYGRVLVEMGKTHKEIVVLTADLAKSTKSGVFFKEYPDRSFNFGIAEQNMMTAAAGLALTGKRPYVSTFACFASMRACEQVRTDICYPRLNVKIMGTHSGLSMGNGGTTHHATEDLAIMRSFAGMTVVVPADGIETAKLVEATIDHDGPLYMRVGRGFEPPAYTSPDYDFEIGKAITMREGKDVTVICCGVTVLAALEAAQELKDENNIEVRVVNMHTIKPLDQAAILAAAKETNGIVTAEEHNIIGGLGSAVAETLLDAGLCPKFKRLGIPDVFSVIGYPEDLYKHYGIDIDGVKNGIKTVLGLPVE